MASFGANLREARKKKKLTQRQLADAIHAKHNSVSNWENDQNKPDPDTIELLCGVLDISPNDLFHTNNNFDLAQMPENQKYPFLYASNVPAYVRIPVVGEIVAGLPTEAIEDAIDWEEISFDQAQRGDYIGLRVKGHSMEPRICEGDTVIIRRQDTIENGELAVVFVNGDDATLKRVKLVDGGIMLIAFNQDVYEPHFYSEKMIRELPVTIYGKVVELRGKF